jgi:hypothetical protein
LKNVSAYLLSYVFVLIYFTDSTFVLKAPRVRGTLSAELWNRIHVSLATRYDTTLANSRRLLPVTLDVLQYGRAIRLDGGDPIQGRELVPLGSDNRDSSYIRVSVFLIVSSYC